MKMDKRDGFGHRTFRDDEFWKEIPAWKNISREEFADHRWQARNSIIKLKHVEEVLGKRINSQTIADIQKALEIAPMNVRMTPYVFALINWEDPAGDPLRRQFLPFASQMLPNHPFYMEDSLHEDVDSPVKMLTHRYPDKVLFLPLTTCPVYCSYCTRSRIIGGSTASVEKDTYGAKPKLWDSVFEYLKNNPQIEDVVISGGDAFNLQASQIKHIGESLLAIPSIRRIRYATKGIAIFPMKILTDDDWFQAICDVVKLGREKGKSVVIHTHFSSPQEITDWSREAMDRLFAEGVIVRNQAVLQSDVNNDVETMTHMTRQLGYINVQPYYVYMHDMVPNCERFRTTLEEGVELEKAVRGCTAGFNTPRFVCDVPGGGGKRNIASYEHYNRETGISVWRAPEVKPGELFLYFDPIHKLAAYAQKRWGIEKERRVMVRDALSKVEPDLGGVKTETLRQRFGINI